jgi:crotonobetaine/carnitine-CoA ligase
MSDTQPQVGIVEDRTDASLVFRYMLEGRAAQTPQRLFASFTETGLQWTWRDLDQAANRAANALGALGVKPGEIVALMDWNSPQYLQGFFGITKLGARVAPVNTAFRGDLLRHVLNLCDARVFICNAEFLPLLAAVQSEVPVEHVVVIGAADPTVKAGLGKRLQLWDFENLCAAAQAAAPADPGIHFWDTYGIIFTSGTTGPSKGVMHSYGQMHAMVEQPMVSHLNAEDVFMVDLPLFHIGAMLSLECTLLMGAAMVVSPKVQVEKYWDIIRQYGVTHATFLAQSANWLWKKPPRPDDAKHGLRKLLGGPFPVNFTEWRARFGITHFYTFFNMTEINGPLMHPPNPPDRPSSGKPRRGVQVRLVDENDFEVPEGQLGELIIRTERPWELNNGYLKMPEATAKAWRNGWFHTGDVFRRQGDDYYYVDRLKDSLRRRGENVSSYEVEQGILAKPEVFECAAVAVRGEDGDDEILAAVVLREGVELPHLELFRFLQERLPYFMVPRFIEFVDTLPKTASQKVQKNKVREHGVGPVTWDCQKEGIFLSRKAQSTSKA